MYYRLWGIRKIHLGIQQGILMEQGGWEDLAYVESIKGEELLASPEEPRYILTVLKFEKFVTEEKIVTLAKF
jgi:hypothetical protein